MGNEQTQSTWQQPAPLCFNIKLQLLMATLAKGTRDPNAGDLLVPVRITPGTVPKDVQATWQIAEVLKDVGISIRDPGLEALSWVGEADTGPDDDRWVIERDDRVDDAELDSTYSWIGIWLKSPKLVGKQEGYDEVNLVAHAITSHFRVHTSAACGYEVDVSNQQGSFSDSLVKRLGQFLWAAEPTLSRYHDPARAALQTDRALRTASLLAGGFGRGDAERQIARDIEKLDRLGEFTRNPRPLRLNKLNGPRTVQRMDRLAALMDMEGSDGELGAEYVTRSVYEDAIQTNLGIEALLETLKAYTLDSASIVNQQQRQRVEPVCSSSTRAQWDVDLSRARSADDSNGSSDYAPPAWKALHNADIKFTPLEEGTTPGHLRPPLWDDVRASLAKDLTEQPAPTPNRQASPQDVNRGNVAVKQELVDKLRISGSTDSETSYCRPAEQCMLLSSTEDISGLRPPSDLLVERAALSSSEETSPPKSPSRRSDGRATLPSAKEAIPGHHRIPPRSPSVQPAGEDLPTTNEKEPCASEAATHIATCNFVEAVGTLLSSAGDARLNYDFRNYSWRTLMDRHEGRAPGPHETSIGFLEAGGSSEPGRLVSWARLCVGIVEWARSAPVRRFRGTVARLRARERAELGLWAAGAGREAYGLSELLWDMQMFGQAVLVRERDASKGKGKEPALD